MQADWLADLMFSCVRYSQTQEMRPKKMPVHQDGRMPLGFLLKALASHIPFLPQGNRGTTVLPKAGWWLVILTSTPDVSTQSAPGPLKSQTVCAGGLDLLGQIMPHFQGRRAGFGNRPSNNCLVRHTLWQSAVIDILLMWSSRRGRVAGRPESKR
jgi:hypothetical protein